MTNREHWKYCFAHCVICGEEFTNESKNPAEGVRGLGVVEDREEPMFTHATCMIKWRRSHPKEKS